MDLRLSRRCCASPKTYHGNPDHGAKCVTDAKDLDRGRYEVVGVLGRSPYATVYEAHDRKSGDRVAVKVLSLAGSHRDIVAAMFRKEVDALDGFDHPAVVRLRGRFTEADADRLGVVLELVPGGRTLEQMIVDIRAGKETRRPLRWRIEQLRRLLSALEAAHRRNVIHRDVKPANILVDRDTDELRLADFGVARLLEHYGRGVEGATLRQFYTRPYAAPEQVLRGEATFASDLHAFGLVAAALFSSELPGDDFRAEQLPTLLESLRAEIRDAALHQALVDVLTGLLRAEPSLRPRVPAIERVLADLVERAADRPAIPIRITTTARTKASTAGCMSTTAILDDLNDGLRARYEAGIDRRTNKESFTIRCYGRGLWGMLKPDDASPEELVLVDLGRNPGPMHARQRESAESVSFRVSEGRGSAEAFVAVLFQAFEAERRRDEERRKKESLLAVAQFVLARQRERLMQLRVSYRVADTDGGRRDSGGGKRRSAFGDKLAAAIGASPPEAPGSPPAASGQHDARGSYLHVEVLDVAPWDDDAEPSDGLMDGWTEGLDRKTPFLLDGIVFATFHNYDSQKRILSLRLKAPRKVPREGTFECKDIALDAALKRQESAIDHFVEDACVNPRLGRLLLYPEENRLGDITPRPLMHSLEPHVEMQSLVERALAAEDFFFVQGPPGTGKTTVIAEVMGQILTADPSARILLTSQANEAVNNALDALRALGHDRKASWRLLRDVSAERADRDQGGFETLFAEWVSATR
ncbi:MAG: protein kinase domain-containing protein, partial [Polyangiaceae bacterium]